MSGECHRYIAHVCGSAPCHIDTTPMDPDSSLLFLGLLLCLMMVAFIAAMDTALASVNRHRVINHIIKDDVQHQSLSQRTSDAYRIKATIALVNAATIIIATLLLLHLTRALPLWSQLSSMLMLLLIILMMSGVVAKWLAIRHPEIVIQRLTVPFRLLFWLCAPIVTPINLLIRPLTHTEGDGHPSPNLSHIEAEMLLLMNAGEREGLIQHDEREMIEGIFAFNETIVREIMVPRVDMIALDVTTPMDDALHTIITAGHSRIPVYRDTIDTIVGMLYAKDLLPALRCHEEQISIATLLRPVHFVPETINVGTLLKELQQAKVHIVVVVDEYGGTAGMATIEDLIEEIFGDIQDEYDREEPAIQRLSETEMVVDARVSIEEIRQHTNINIESTQSDRMGGLIYEQLGRIPQPNDEMSIEGLTVRVLSIKGVRPDKLHITFPYSLTAEESTESTIPDQEVMLSPKPTENANEPA